ncbi:MAG: hypothetical protein SFX46_00485, partial [Aeromonas hydrophila]|nr:hypothetical protein [Aeromonas hydrophila]
GQPALASWRRLWDGMALCLACPIARCSPLCSAFGGGMNRYQAMALKAGWYGAAFIRFDILEVI